MKDKRPIRRGEIWWVDFNPARGSEQAGRRPALVLQSDLLTSQGVRTVVVAAMSTGSHGPETLGDDVIHINVEPSRLNGLVHSGVVKCEQVLTVAVDRLETYSGVLEPRLLQKVERALRVILGLG